MPEQLRRGLQNITSLAATKGKQNLVLLLQSIGWNQPRKRGQTGAEYMFLIGTAIMFVVIVIVLANSKILSPGTQAINNYTGPVNTLIRNISNSTG